MADRKNFINSGVLEYGLNSSEMDNALKEGGFAPLSVYEKSLIDHNRYGKNFEQRFKDNSKELASGLSTAVSGFFQNPLGYLEEGYNYVTSHTLPQMVGDVSEAILTPFNLDPQTAGKNFEEGGLKQVAEGVVAGVLTNPADATIMLMPEIGGGINKLAQKAVKSEKLGKYIPSGVKGLVSPEYKEVDAILRDARQVSSPRYENLKAQNTRIQNADVKDIAQAVKNLENGIVEGTETQINLTNELKTMVNDINKVLEEGGFDPNLTRENTVNQYVTRFFQNKGIDIPVSKVTELKANPSKLEKLGVTPEELDAAIVQGNKLYTEGLIRPIKHNMTAETVREGLVEESAKKVRGKNDKLYGTQSYEDVAQGIKSGAYDNMLKTIRQSESTVNAVDEIIKTTGRAVRDIAELAEDEVLISPKLLREKMGTSLAVGESVNSPLESLTRGLNKAEREIYSDNLYAVKKNHIKALQNAYVGREEKLIGGIFGKAANLAKPIALATPRYIAGNATTNLAMAAISGTNLSHYIKAIKNIDDIPEILRRTASYSGYLEDTLPLRSGYKEIYDQLFRDLKSGDQNKQMLALNAFATTPIFKSANSMETLQRAAEYFNQAEKYAKEVNKTTKEILEEAKANRGLNSTYRKLNKRVEEVLGDYTGRNYHANRTLTDVANTLLPFYRPFTQAPRQFYHAARDYRLGTQLGFNVPSQYGNQIQDAAKELYGIEPYESQGGYPVMAPTVNSPGRVIYNQYLPFSPVAEMINNPLDVFQGNPFLGALSRIASGRTRFNEDPLPPNTYRLYGGEMVVLDNNGNVAPYRPEEHLVDRLKFMGSEALKTFTPVSGINSYVLPTISLLTGQEYRKPADTVPFGQVGNFIIPGVMEGSTARPLQPNKEILLPQLGFNYADTYPPKRTKYTPQQFRGNRKQIIRKIEKQKRR